VRDREGHPTSRGVGRAGAREGTDVGATVKGYRGGVVCVGASFRMRRGGDVAWWGVVVALPRRCSLLLGGAPVAASMKGL
jgi:hypothetical protein